MGNIRVHELATELRKSNREVSDRLRKLGIPARTNLSSIKAEDANRGEKLEIGRAHEFLKNMDECCRCGVARTPETEAIAELRSAKKRGRKPTRGGLGDRRK